MNTRIFIAVVCIASMCGPFAFGQMRGSYSAPQSQPPPSTADRTQPMTKTSTTKTVMPKGVKGYLDAQMAGSKDKKFHVALNGKDVSLTPVTFHPEQKLGGGKAATAVDMKGADGKIYEIDFVTANDQVIGAHVGKVNGKAP